MDVLVIAENEVRIYTVSEPQPIVNFYFYNILTCKREDIPVRVFRYYAYKFYQNPHIESIDVLFQYITPEAKPSFLYYMSLYEISPKTHILKMV